MIFIEKKDLKHFQEGEIKSDNINEIDVYKSYYSPVKSGIKVIRNISNFLNFYRPAYKCFRKYLKDKGKPDLISVQVVYPLGIFAYFLKLFYGIPYVISEHWSGYSDSDGRYEKLPGLYKTLIRKTFKNSDGVSAVSKFLAGLIKNKNLYEKEVEIIPNVIRIPENTADKKNDSGEIKILSVSVLDDKTKNISSVISVFSDLCSKYDNIVLNIYGEGEDRKFLEELSESHNLLNKKIFFHGNAADSEIDKLYQSHSFMILNSNFETFSVVAAEAIANGLPVAVTKCGGPEEFVDESSGILINKNDNADLKNKMEFMINNYKKFDAGKMHEHIKQKYSSEAAALKLKQFFSKALNMKKN